GILPEGSWFAKRGNIDVTIGEVIDPQTLRNPDESDWHLALRMRELARSQILQHCGEPDMGHEQVFIPPRQSS
ncbi:MAG: hypothetical protein AB2551_15010, partial [Candidatus Thiodiazotropha sp.]